MAGGSGKRFWPRSRKNTPKQLLDIVSDETMLRLTFDRMKQITTPDKIYVVAGPHLEDSIKQELPEMPSENMIVEPSGKNTAPCIGLAAIQIESKDPNAIMSVFPSDHLIKDTEKFKQLVLKGGEFARKSKNLVTFGIQPTRPSTGFGYIEFDESGAENEIYGVKQFREKPNEKIARDFLAQGNFLWNSGMFIWKVDTILAEIKTNVPDLYNPLQQIKQVIGTKDYSRILRQEWEKIPADSIDYAVMEKADKVSVLKATFDWNDVGAWNSVYDISEKDENGNVVKGELINIGSKNNYFYSKDKQIVAIGLEDLIVVEDKGAILIAKKSEAEKVSQIIQELHKQGKEKLT